MSSYRVFFMNEIPRNDKLFRCCQRSIIIRLARSPERAVEAAKKRFTRLEGIRDWKIHAALIEIDPVDLESIPNTRGSRRDTQIVHK
jgi:hypothetical protein